MNATPTRVDASADLGALLSAAVAALDAVPREIDLLRSLDDDALLELTRVAADEVRLAELHVSLLAGEIARRSAPELGSNGLAQRTGHRTPDELVRVTTGTRQAAARTAVRVGAVAGSATAVGAAVLNGRVSVAVADAITTGLGRPGAGVDAGALDAAAGSLIDRVEGLDADRAGREARAVRDELDLAGVADREAERREQRSFRLGRRANGMGWAHWELDPETFAIVSDIYDRVTNPRRRTPAFSDDKSSTDNTAACPSVDAADGDGRGAEPTDGRTPEQYASDMFAELLRQGLSADTSGVLGDAPGSVRVIVAAKTLTARSGRGWLEGQPDPISIDTVERLACTGGTITITVDDTGQPLNLGRDRRLFSRAQRIALAARDGGCRWPGCERPPSWCEAHHINHWQRDTGRTDIADGILLCRHHHLLAHNNGWEIRRAGPSYALTPPGHPPSTHADRDMPPRSPALRDALRA
ncbi:uncharacterized protein DUF222 [Microcella putealis]|uniref:Uncharacterized protein DUF222 n=1 Tax=Microcella putealis TaxID=337005 RepID=A0A4Q7LLG1_9MICO|nr:HNH endonuclease signature motif containing protein [Microcella putealis]RZS55062.1 uncharacterized protein DUF222 [Microcella putealis]TQM19598.1 uncharacterized protein DUF222 [Microcella putealis]